MSVNAYARKRSAQVYGWRKAVSSVISLFADGCTRAAFMVFRLLLAALTWSRPSRTDLARRSSQMSWLESHLLGRSCTFPPRGSRFARAISGGRWQACCNKYQGFKSLAVCVKEKDFNTRKNRLITFIVASCLALVSPAVLSEDDYPRVWLNPGFFSYHFDRDKDLREDNWGFGAEVEFSADHVAMAGTFINSNGERSRYLGYQWRPLHWKPKGVDVHVGAILAAMDGYPRYKEGDWFVAALPLLAVQGKRLGANFSIVPTIENRLDGAFVFQLRFRVW